MPMQLNLFGGAFLEGTDGPLTGGAVQRHRIALLAMLAVARGRTVARDKAMALLWPERDAPRARALLNQAVHVLRQTIGSEALVTAGEELQLDARHIHCDVVAFETAVAAGDLEAAIREYRGPFLDGFFLPDSPEFEQFVDRERTRLAADFARALELLADRAAAAGDARAAADHWQRRVVHDPLDSRAVMQLMRALEAVGNPAAALRQAELHQQRLREELAIELPPEVHALSERLRGNTPRDSKAALAALVAPAAHITPAVPQLAVPGGTPAVGAPVVAPLAAAHAPMRARALRLGAAITAVATLLAITLLARGAGRTRENVAGVSVDEIAMAVAEELARRERGEPGVRTPAERTTSIPAYEEYLRGSDRVLLRSDSSARIARKHFERAVHLDPRYAAAWAGLARLTLRTNRTDPSSFARTLDSAEAASRRAIALDDSLAEAHAALALVVMVRNRLPQAERELRRAIDLEPSNPDFRGWLARLYLWQGRRAEALEETTRAHAAQPTLPTTIAELARSLLANGRAAEALERLRAVEGLDPPLPRAVSTRAQALAALGRWDAALDAVRPTVKNNGTHLFGLHGYLLGRAGHRDSARARVAPLEAIAPQDIYAATALGLLWFGLDDPDAAASWLERAMSTGGIHPLDEQSLLLRDQLDAYRAHPRIAAIRTRLGIQNE